ncbi:hypothetical protein SDC9_203385 [bioreactor metagenome]|uniref:Uncharacterized protein n=1 Tax=bioreactor metagenome TaxID=1076179 RepID=A0A645IWJ2_9ZZZZ
MFWVQSVGVAVIEHHISTGIHTHLADQVNLPAEPRQYDSFVERITTEAQTDLFGYAGSSTERRFVDTFYQRVQMSGSYDTKALHSSPCHILKIRQSLHCVICTTNDADVHRI